jgi:SAM-dependent methyltransferase
MHETDAAVIDPNNDPAVTYESVTTCLCGGRLDSGPVWHWDICSQCGTWVNTRRPTAGSVAAVYGPVYWTATQTIAGAPTLEQRFNRDMHDRIPQYLGALRPHLRPASRIGEFGCGNARILHELAAEGHDMVGAEMDPSVVERVRRLTDRVDIGHTMPADHEDGSFDALLSIDVLEHVHEPQAYLAEHARLLRPDGVLLLHTPVHDRPEAPYRYSVGMLWKLYHLFLFSRSLLDRMVAEAGLTCVDDTTVLFGWPVLILRRS